MYECPLPLLTANQILQATFRSARARRRALMDRAVSEELIVLSFHLPFPGLGRIKAAGDGWECEPVV